MRYSHQVVKFWRTGYKQFHGRFIRFLSGYKNLGQKINGLKFEPKYSRINFAIPDIRLLAGQNDLSKTANPGVLYDMLNIMDSNTLYNLCFDGKKINSGKTEKRGDIDLFGHEKPPTLSERKERLARELGVLSELEKQLNVESVWGDNLEQIELSHKKTLVKQYEKVNLIISERIKELRQSKVSKTLALEKFKKLSGPHWRKGKYLYVISSLETQVFDINISLSELLYCLDKVHASLCTLHGSISNFCEDRVMKLSNQANYHCLDTEFNNPECTKDCRFVPQRTDEWFKLRKEAVVTGSTAQAALGLSSLKKQKEHYDKFILGHDLKETDTESKRRMQYGTDNEINCVSTLVAKILPTLFPDIHYYEEGCVTLKHTETCKIFFVVSPDGSGKQGDCDNIDFEFTCHPTCHEKHPRGLERHLNWCPC
jgi:hypothetical protein